MSFVNWLRGVKAKVDIEPIEDGNVILQNNGDGTADLFVDQGNQRLHVIDSTQTSGGHTIWNRIKTALTARANLWFKDANVSDASTDGATAVEVVTELQSESAFDNLATDGSADGVYVFPDSGGEYLDAYMVGYGNSSVGDALGDTVSKSNGGTFSDDVSVDKGSGSSYLYIGGASSKGNVNVYNNSGRFISIRYSDDATHNRAATFKDLNGQIVAASNFDNNFTASQTINLQNGTTSALGYSDLWLGNDTPEGTAGNDVGRVILYGKKQYFTILESAAFTRNSAISLPDQDGIVAITSSAVGGLFVESFTATSLTSGFVNVAAKIGYKPVFAMVTNLPTNVACRGIMWDGSTYYLRLEQWNSNQTWTPYATATSCNIVAGYVPN